MNFYRSFAWPILARLDPERAHTLVLRLLALAQETPGVLALLERLCAVRDSRLAVEAFGLRFPNPVGLAAGLDKDARAAAAFAALGFGAVEVGTITPLGQPGNPRPRIFRLPAERALINRMGFPNQGATRARARLRRTSRPLSGSAVLGVNLGKNAQTTLAEAARDYVTVLDTLHDQADYAVVNVSSPNTQGLRSLQERRSLEDLLSAVIKRRDSLTGPVAAAPRVVPGDSPIRPSASPVRPGTPPIRPGTPPVRPGTPPVRPSASEGSAPASRQPLSIREAGPSLHSGRQGRALPILVKVAPDLDWDQLAAVVEAARATHLDGIVATNTTLARDGVRDPRKRETGGLSGEPLRARSTEVVRWLARETGGTLPIVGVGGISQPDHALAMLDAGAVLVQVYTGLIYEGPTLPARICRTILERQSRTA